MFKPCLEELERRDCPTVTLHISSLQELANHSIRVSGTASDSAAMVNLDTVSITTADNSGDGTVHPNAAGAWTLDISGVTEITTFRAYMVSVVYFSEAYDTKAFTSTVPTITNFVGTDIGGGLWTFTGTVTDDFPTGLVVRFTGPSGSDIDGDSATVASNGTFTVTVNMRGKTGNVFANVSDWYSQAATQAVYTVF